MALKGKGVDIYTREIDIWLFSQGPSHMNGKWDPHLREWDLVEITIP